MKAALALALLSLAALAAPYGDKHDDNEVSKYDDKHESKYDGKHESKYDNKHDDKHDDDCAHSKGAYPFEFTSTLVAYAGPDAIINNSQVAVPGLAGGWGEFRIGLNSIDNVICYVSIASSSFHVDPFQQGILVLTIRLTSRTSPCGSRATTHLPP